MKMYLLDDILLISEVPDRLSSAEAQALVEEIDKCFSQSGRKDDAGASKTKGTRGRVFYFDGNQKLTTSKDK